MTGHEISIIEAPAEVTDIGIGHPIVKEGGFFASCSCGWSANNPLDEAAAHSAAAYHLESAEVETKRAEAVAAFHAANTDADREQAHADYLRAGVVTDEAV